MKYRNLERRRNDFSQKSTENLKAKMKFFESFVYDWRKSKIQVKVQRFVNILLSFYLNRISLFIRFGKLLFKLEDAV